MNKKFPKIELPFPYRPKKRKENGVVGVTGLNLSSGDGFGNSGEGTTAMSESANEDAFVYKYSCAMLNLSSDVAPILRYWSKKHIPVVNLYINEDEGMEGFETMPHVTVKYGLHDTSPTKITEIAKNFGIIDLSFGNVTKFDHNPNFDVIKVDINGEKLRYLNIAISNEMEHTDSFDSYKPHATLAYVKKGSCDHLLDNDYFNKLNDSPDEIYFASRNGEEYIIKL